MIVTKSANKEAPLKETALIALSDRFRRAREARTMLREVRALGNENITLDLQERLRPWERLQIAPPISFPDMKKVFIGVDNLLRGNGPSPFHNHLKIGPFLRVAEVVPVMTSNGIKIQMELNDGLNYCYRTVNKWSTLMNVLLDNGVTPRVMREGIMLRYFRPPYPANLDFCSGDLTIELDGNSYDAPLKFKRGLT
jgi:hypothetical protein